MEIINSIARNIDDIARDTKVFVYNSGSQIAVMINPEMDHEYQPQDIKIIVKENSDPDNSESFYNLDPECANQVIEKLESPRMRLVIRKIRSEFRETYKQPPIFVNDKSVVLSEKKGGDNQAEHIRSKEGEYLRKIIDIVKRQGEATIPLNQIDIITQNNNSMVSWKDVGDANTLASEISEHTDSTDSFSIRKISDPMLQVIADADSRLKELKIKHQITKKGGIERSVILTKAFEEKEGEVKKSV